MTDDTSPTPPAEPGVDDVPVAGAAAPVPAPAPASGPVASIAPYRVIHDSTNAPFARPRSPSLLGAAVFVFGVLLWAFVVMGELTTSYAPGRHQMLVGEALAVVFVLATSAAAWGIALRRSLATIAPATPLATYARGGFIALVAIAMWMAVIFCATVLGKAGSKSLDGPITMMLLILAVAAALGGRRLAGLRGKPATSRQRWVARLLWTGASLVSFVAFVEILGS